jgi:hypothetical protein
MTYESLNKDRIPLSEWELAEMIGRARDASKFSYGQRGAAFRSIAADYGVSVRTVQRYLRTELKPVKVAGYRALFLIRQDRAPTQVTTWERAA